MQFIDLNKQYKLIKRKILKSISYVLEHGQYIMGPEVQKLEEQLANFIGVKHAIVNSSGTDALLMSLLALQIGYDDEVITSSFSFFSTVEVIMLCKAKPVFVDIDPNTYNIDANKIPLAITSKTKAIIVVNLYGQCADMDKINNIALQYGLPVIEDAAQSFGSTYKGSYSCTLSTIGCTSFFPSKPLGGYGDSGACFTNDDVLAKKLMQIRIHGQNKKYSHCCIGINGRMDTIQAAILLEKIRIFPNEIIMRQNVAKQYEDLLYNIVKTPTIIAGNKSIFSQYTIEIPKRDIFKQKAKTLGIPTAIHYPIAVHQQKALSHLGYKMGDFPHAERASKFVLSLPMHAYLEIREQQFIAKTIRNFLLDNKLPFFKK